MYRCISSPYRLFRWVSKLCHIHILEFEVKTLERDTSTDSANDKRDSLDGSLDERREDLHSSVIVIA